MSYQLSRKSISRMAGIHPDLDAVIRLAIQLTPIDFGVSEGVRSIERQRELVQAKASRTMRSRHLPQEPHGHAEAVDLYAYVAGAARWELALYEQIADACRDAALSLGVSITWGGSWPWRLTGRRSATELVQDYIDLRRSQGRQTFIDAPHFQIEGAR